MPIDKYFKGHGSEVMDSMQKSYGKNKAKKVFYATANKKKMKPNHIGPSEETEEKMFSRKRK